MGNRPFFGDCSSLMAVGSTNRSDHPDIAKICEDTSITEDAEDWSGWINSCDGNDCISQSMILVGP